ncbi:hypothetical protein H7142_00950 [Candidatus Saccharibacteria bacterium]|nr:hypothetical protein [Candidatus Saccharibacteria bacterium]
MKKMSTSELTARINRFMDRKMSTMVDVTEVMDQKVRRTHRQHIEVPGTPFIVLAIK